MGTDTISRVSEFNAEERPPRGEKWLSVPISARALAALLLCLAAPAAELARWDAAGARGITLARGPDAGYTVQDGLAVIHPVNDYFRRAAFLVRLEQKPEGRCWLAIEYLDRGYALISIEPGVPHSRQSGVARLDTGAFRHAVFAFDRLPAAEFRVHGIEKLRSVSLHDAPPPVQPPPVVKPALRFSRPGQRVTTAGADASTPEGLPEALATLRNLLPLARALGFNGIESYVKWNFIERSPGVFNWSFYDAVVDEIEKAGMQWFPLLIAGSAYALPDWYFEMEGNTGFVCLEHGITSEIPSIFCHHQDRYVERFLKAFGQHYGGRKALLGVRLGPSGNYGEAQYPARGAWGYRGRPLHTHIGYWAGDRCAAPDFRAWLRRRYPDIQQLNAAWEDRFPSWEQVAPFLPLTAVSERKRIDFADWYMDAMSDWCAQWAEWARAALPRAVIHQSSGGWGPIEIGTDYTHQARTMARLKGGVRLTNESDNFPQNFAITRMASSAARFYGAALGYEPGGFGSARGVVARLFNAATNDAEHLFYYHPNLLGNDQAVNAWLRHASLLDRRAKPLLDVAAFYPDTAVKLDDEPLRYLWASAFLSRVEAMRSTLDFDYLSEPMVLDGALDRFKVLLFLWGHVTEKPVLERIVRWVESGGTLIYPERPRGPLRTVDGDLTVWKRWKSGHTGQGRVIFFPGDPEPGQPYARFVRDELRKINTLRPATAAALRLEKPADVYWSLLESGELWLLNFSDDPAEVRLPSGRRLQLAPYTILCIPWPDTAG